LARVDRVLSSSVREHTIGIKKELFNLAVPAIVGQAIDPVAQLLETAYVGRLGIFSLFTVRRQLDKCADSLQLCHSFTS
jgi:hypothetical protein